MASSKNLSQIFDNLSSMLEAGVPVERSLRVTARQAGSNRLQRALENASDMVAGGSDLTEALKKQRSFPDLVINLIEAGEASGRTDRVCGELSSYYQFQHQMWSAFLASLTLPALQYIAAVFVLALVQYVMGMFSGGSGLWSAIMILLWGYGTPVGLILTYFVTTRTLKGSRVVHETLLHIPVIKNVSRSLALARFSLVMHMMLEAGIPVVETSQKAFEATGNKAFIARRDLVRESIQRGSNLTDALSSTEMFPREYLEVVSVGEESGTTSERFEWLAGENRKKARQYLTGLMTTLGYVIWAIVAGFIIFSIFRFFTQYIGKINQLTGI
ncbi:MAG: type II secretion system F family protein [Planctomycetota bacterium]